MYTCALITYKDHDQVLDGGVTTRNDFFFTLLISRTCAEKTLHFLHNKVEYTFHGV